MGKGRGQAGERAAGGGGDDDALLPWQQSHVDQSLPQVYIPPSPRGMGTTRYGYHVPACGMVTTVVPR